jgi:toxin ParE1/3/4
MAQVIWSARATAHLQEITSYIRRGSPKYSKIVAREIVAATRRLKRMPLSGRVIPEFENSNFREIFQYNYRILYQIEGDLVRILGLIHGKRKLNSIH